MAEFKDAETVSFDLTDLAQCIFLFGEKEGRKVWETFKNPIVVTNPRSCCTITGIDADNNTIYFGSPEGYQVKGR